MCVNVRKWFHHESGSSKGCCNKDWWYYKGARPPRPLYPSRKITRWKVSRWKAALSWLFVFYGLMCSISTRTDQSLWIYYGEWITRQCGVCKTSYCCIVACLMCQAGSIAMIEVSACSWTNWHQLLLKRTMRLDIMILPLNARLDTH